jgi:hypothetical protein
MRYVLAVLLLSGCGLAGQLATEEAVADAKACLQAVKSSPDGKTVYARLWANDDTDTAAKLYQSA